MKVIKFFAPWCAPCVSYATTFEQVQQRISFTHPQVEWEEVNIDSQPQLAAVHGITSIPATIIMDGDQVLDKRVGNLTYEELSQAVASHLQ